jgi:hypothetical protein
MKVVRNFIERAAVAALFLFVGCTTGPRPLASVETPANARFSISYVHAHYLELEPCGCSMAPLGGLAREYNLVNQWRRDGDIIALSGGATFFPLFKDSKLGMPDLKLKSTTMVEGLGRIGISGLGISAEDMKIGLPHLIDLSKKAKFPFLSANLVSKKSGRPLFNSHAIFRANGRSIFVTALTGGRSDTVLPKELELKDPIATMQLLLKEIPPENRSFVVVLSSLSQAERDLLVKVVPDIHLVLGLGKGEESGPVQLTANTISGTPRDRGRGAMRFVFEGPQKFTGLYSKETSEEIRRTLYDEGVASGGASLDIRAAKTSAERSIARRRMKKADARIAELEKIPLEESPTTLRLVTDSVLLSSDYDQPMNSLKELLTTYHQTLREVSIAELD